MSRSLSPQTPGQHPPSRLYPAAFPSGLLLARGGPWCWCGEPLATEPGRTQRAAESTRRPVTGPSAQLLEIISRFHPGSSPYQGTGEGAGSGGRAAPKEACPGRRSGLRLAGSRSQEAAKLGAGRGPGSLCFPSPLKPGKSLMSRPRAGGLLTWGGTQAPGSRGFFLPHSGGWSSWTRFSADLRPEAGWQTVRCPHRVT